MKNMQQAITKDNLKQFVEDLMKTYNVYAPKRDNENTVLYGVINSFDEYEGNVLLTNTTAKDKVYLQSEKFFDFKKTHHSIELKHDEEIKKTIIFGCRPCDARGFNVVDKLFNWAEYKDEYYLSRRQNTLILTVSCQNPEITCFCTSFKDGSPASGMGSDLLFTEIKKDKYLVDVLTSNGQKLVNDYKKYFESVNENDSNLKEEFKKGSESKIVKKIDTVEIKKKLDNAFESSYWDAVHLPCVKCGVCTFVCPTCYCFDITEKIFDYINGERNRTWDTCMSETFTKMAGGINPRFDSKRRFRQRFMHKFKYHVDNFKEELCTGCGRCIKYCPVGIDVRKVLEEVK
ncbi:MAG: 4Fe-4S dicluster domain-containing protein [Candidatus Firestonebacteria bacterium]